MKTNGTYLIGMIHLPPTIGYKGWPGMSAFLKKAKIDLLALQEGGVDAALIENDGDTPCKVLGSSDVIVPMTIVAQELKKIATIPLGIEVLLNDPKASLTIARATDLDFIRSDYFVDRMTRPGYGEFKIDPKGVMKYREEIGANDIKVFIDVQVKYASMINKKKKLATSVKQAIRYGASGVIVSGTLSGVEPIINDVIEAKKASQSEVPVLIGSGFAKENAEELLQYADWAIVGNSIKTKGCVDINKTKTLVNLIKSIDHNLNEKSKSN